MRRCRASANAPITICGSQIMRITQPGNWLICECRTGISAAHSTNCPRTTQALEEARDVLADIREADGEMLRSPMMRARNRSSGSVGVVQIFLISRH